LKNHNSSLKKVDDFDDIEIEPLEDPFYSLKLYTTNTPDKMNVNSEDVNVNEALSELSLLEGNTLFQRGDIEQSVSNYQDALKYSSKKQELFLKIEQYLSLENNVALGSEQVLVKLTRQNKDLSLSIDKAIKPASKQNSLVSVTNKPTALIKPQQNAEGAKLLDKKNGTEPKIKKTDNPNLKKTFQTTSVSILCLIGFITFFGFSTVRQEKRVQVKLLAPQDQATIKTWPILFSWHSSNQQAHYLLQVIDNEGDDLGKLVFQFRTSETNYIFSQETIKHIKKYHKYKWRIVPVTENQEKIAFSENSSEFVTLTLNKD